MASVVIIGYGSIGARHARVAGELGHEVEVVSRRAVPLPFPVHRNIAAALEARLFDKAVVATETSAHAEDLAALLGAGFRGDILVEKPLFATAEQDAALSYDAATSSRLHVAYNLRFHPLITQFRAFAGEGKILNVAVHAGQDLRQWRAGRAVEDTYSSRKDGGGGVLRDLSHELDYLLWILGPWREVSAMGGRLGDLPGDADDIWNISLRFRSGALVNLTLDYHCRPGVRTITANRGDDTLAIDIVTGRAVSAGGERRMDPDRDLTYRAQMGAFCTGAGSEILCSYKEGLETMMLIDAIERSADQRAWISA